MSAPAGRTLPLSAARRLVGDVLYVSRKVPAAWSERRMNLAPLAAARRARVPRVGWCSLFIKAYSLVAMRHAELRRAYLRFPRPRLYEHPHNSATVTIERRYGGEKCVLFARLPEPERLALDDLEAILEYHKQFPVPGIASYRMALKVSAWPWPLRRLVWWAAMNISGERRARYFGTFGVTVTSGLGAAVLHGPTPVTSTLTYGILDGSGTLNVRLAFDHRVFDGGTAARVLKDLERTLLGQIVAELTSPVAAEAA